MGYHILKYDSVSKMISDLKNPKLVDIQTVKNFNTRLYYIFHSELYPNDKVICEYTNKNNYYYFIDEHDRKEPFMPINQLKMVIGNYDTLKKYDSTENTYEKDLNISTRHALDFYKKFPDNSIAEEMKIMYLDIELDASKMNTMPSPKKPYAPIVMISYAINDSDVYTISLKHNKLDYNNDKLKNTIFVNNEKQLISQFISILHDISPDILTAWNASFDYGYIASRMYKLYMDPNELSPLKYVDGDTKFYIKWAGYVILDMLTLYKNFTYHTMESYTLDDVAEYELGENKLEYDGSIVTLWNRDPTNMIIYNIQDVRLLQKLQDKLNHINLQNEIREFSGLDWNKSSSTIGVLDGLLIKYARHYYNEAIQSKLSSHPNENGKVKGAYVMQPLGGLYKWCIDLDYSSLYPSITRTFNIGIETLLGKVSEQIAFNYLYKNELPDTINIIYNVNKYNEYTKKITKEEFLNILEDHYLTITGAIYLKHEKRKSLYYVILTDLINKRKVYKAKLYENVLYNIKQLAMKVIANSLYGASKNKYFRFVNDTVAESITSTGRELIKLSSLTVDKMLYGETDNNKIFDYAFKELAEQYYDDNIKTKYVIYCDTDSMFINLEELIDKNNIIDSINQLAIKCENIVNKNLIDILIKRRQLQESYLDVKQEWIAKSLYMTGVKKKYALWIINENKKEIDKVKFMGIEIKRSDIPKYSRNKLKSILIDILKEKVNVQDIIDFVTDGRLEMLKLIKSGDISLGKSVSFSKEMGQYKNMPQHIKAMMLWNYLMGEEFRPGSRGKLFAILGWDNIIPKDIKGLQSLGKINAIVIPNTYKKIPNNFIIDSNKMIQTYWDDLFNRTLQPLLTMDNIQLESF